MFTHIANQTTMNPTGDQLTSELQHTIPIEPPAVVGQGEKTTITEKVASGVEKTGQKLEEGLGTIVSGVEYTGHKLVSGVEYTGEKLKATGEFIGEKLGETFAATGEKIEQTIQKAADVVAEEKVELPGVVTLLQTGAAKIFGHLTGSVTQSTPSIAPATATAPPTSPILPVLKSDTKEAVVLAEQNIVGDIITTDIKIGHWVEKPESRIDVMKQTGQLGPQAELHLPNLHVRDMPTNRAVEEQPVYPSEAQLPSLSQKEVQEGAQFIDTVEKKTIETIQTEAMPSFVYIHPQPATQSEGEKTEDQKVDNLQSRTDQLPSLTSRVVLDSAAFMDSAEQQVENQHTKDDSAQVLKEQLPNLTHKAIHDGAAFMDQAEHHKSSQAKGTVNRSDLPSLSHKDVQAGTRFLDVVENSM
jgi:hypothetical protein